jgi:hypothetical protein
MNWNNSCGTQRVLSRVLFLLTISFSLFNSHGVASVLPIGVEQDSWSDMAFPSGVSGGYSTATKVLNVGGSPSNDLEIGPEYGPSNPGRHYGTGGSLGGSFGATLSVTGLEVQSDGTVTDGGLVRVVLNGSAAGSIGADYGITPGTDLLRGTVLEVLLDATGDNTLDILFEITSGALQVDNTAPDVGVFAPNGLAILRIAGTTLPSDFSTGFVFSSTTTVDILGIPEPNCFLLAASLGMVSMLFRQRS